MFSYRNSEELYALLTKRPLNHSYYHLFEPDRSKVYDCAKKGLGDFYLLKYDEVSDEVRGFYHSRHGTGVLIPKEDLTITTTVHADVSALSKEPNAASIDEDCGGRSATSRGNDDAAAAAGVEREYDTVPPNIFATQLSSPSCLSPLSERNSLGSIGTMHHFEDRDEELPKTILKTTWTSDQDGSIRSEQSLIPTQRRRLQKQQNKMDRTNQKAEESIESEIFAKEKAGLFCCREKDAIGNVCKYSFTKQIHLTKHQEKGIHIFPRLDLKSELIEKACNGSFALNFDVHAGNIQNRSLAVASSVVITEKEGIMDTHRDVPTAWCEGGCWRKKRPDRKKKNFKLTPELHKDLEMLFLDGERRDGGGAKQNASKYTPEQAIAQLSNMVKLNKRRKYSNDENNQVLGPLPTLAYIRSWFSRRARNAIKPLVHGENDDDYTCMKSTELKQLCGERQIPLTPIGAVLIRILQVDDDNNGLDEGSYGGLTNKELQNRCVARELPKSLKKETYELLLQAQDLRTYRDNNCAQLEAIRSITEGQAQLLQITRDSTE